MDTTGLQHLDWANYHMPEDLHLNNSLKECSDENILDHQNLNVFESIQDESDILENYTVLSSNSDKESWQTTQESRQLKNTYNNNMSPEISLTNDLNETDSLSGIQQLPELTRSTDIRYDLASLHLSDKGSPFKRIRDAECESVSSDYSEVVGPLRDLADNEIQIFHSEDLEKDTITEKCNSFCTNTESLKQQFDETDEEFKKRVKKVNFLSLAQEFAELKKIDADVLPFDLHKTDFSDYSPMSEESSLVESTMASPVEPAETLLAPYNYVKDENSNELDSVDCCDPEGIINMELPDSSSSGVDSVDTKTYKTSNAANTYKTSLRDINNLDMDIKASPKHGKSNLSLWENKQKRNSEIRNEANEEQECEIYNMESTLPKMDWEALELQLALAEEEKSHCNDREEIRRKLAMGGDEEYYNADRMFKKGGLQSRYQGGMNLQLCFMNENSPGDSSGGGSSSSSNGAVSETAAAEHGPDHQKIPVSSAHRNFPELKSDWSKHLRDHDMHPPPPPKPPRKKVDNDNEEEDFFRKQAQLQEEAKLALAQASTMAHMQLQVEKQMKKKSPIAEMVGIPGFGDGRQKQLERKLLLDMNVAQLQVIVNDLLSQIKSLNEDLVQMLLDRDDLHMEQDSMLVDIEDLTRRAQDFAKKINSKQKKDKNK